MTSEVNEFIQKEQLFSKGDHLILALSGGKDSMALLHLLQEKGSVFTIAHCNFKLRGSESDEDAKVIKEFAQAHKIACHIVSFETNEYAKNKGVSIQEAARELRYDFLEDLRKEVKAKYIVTAHHLDDNIETMLFNLTKGSSDAIKAYIAENNIAYREDSSNASLKYTRNKIRQTIIPVLIEINPQLSNGMVKHFQRWREMDMFYQEMMSKARKDYFEYRNQAIYISIEKIKKLAYRKSLLFGLLEAYGFNNSDVEDVFQSIDLGNEKKQFNSKAYHLIKDRKFLILQETADYEANRVHVISSSSKQVKFGQGKLLQLKKKPLSKLSKMDNGKDVCYMDYDKLAFPLVLRKWERGDYFYPLGLYKSSGKITKKNIGKLLRDLKIDAVAQDGIWVLTSGEKIVWVVGERMDDRFKITESTKAILQIKLK